MAAISVRCRGPASVPRRNQFAAGKAVSVRQRTVGSTYSPGRRTTVNFVVVALLSVSIPLTAVVLHRVQDSLERWEQRRHADD
ncbi:MAG: hypothetical protein ACM4D3_06785 [Candidatus Sericytochromatia bacterium]